MRQICGGVWWSVIVASIVATALALRSPAQRGLLTLNIHTRRQQPLIKMPAVIAGRMRVVRLVGGEDEVKICPRGAARGENDCWLDADLIQWFGDGELSVATKQHKKRGD